MVKVNIFGEDYKIKGDANSEYIMRIADYLDRMMRSASERLTNRSHNNVAVLAAFHIADELFKVRNESENSASAIRAKLESLYEQLHRCIISRE